MKTSLISIIVLLTGFTLSAATSGTASSDPSLTVHLLDYLAKDYAGAIKDGKILKQSEYDEQLEFAETVRRSSHSVSSYNKSPDFLAQVDSLVALIQRKADPSQVSPLARKLQQQAIVLAGIEVSPPAWPELQQGQKLFQAQCVSCHGETGHGDGLAGAHLEPKPANFHDPELVASSSPYKFYNTIRLGVPGTAMVGFSNLSDKEVWDVAFYLKSLAHSASTDLGPSAFQKFSLKEISSLTDSELEDKLKDEPKDQRALIVASVRSHTPPPSGSKGTLEIAQQLLSSSFQSAQNKDFPQAENQALRSYLEGIEPLEPKMKANVPGLTEKIEGLMSAYRSTLNSNSTQEQIASSYKNIEVQLNETKNLLSEKKMSAGIAFGAAFTIFLREGFEAVLIIIVLLSILKAMGQTQAIKWVHAGWITAVGLGLATWFASGLLLQMSGLSRELLEGGISVLAVLVLLYVGFWLHRYSEAKKWRLFLEEKLKTSLTTGSYFVLSVVAFMAVFREAFEVVLFLRAIWMDLDSSGQTVASFGVILSFVVLIGLSYFAVKESKKLPLGKLFEICSWTMIALAFILAGKGIHSLQEAGLVSVHDLSFNFRADLIGVFPSAETVIAQIIVLLVFGGLLFREQKTQIAKVS